MQSTLMQGTCSRRMLMQPCHSSSLPLICLRSAFGFVPRTIFRCFSNSFTFCCIAWMASACKGPFGTCEYSTGPPSIPQHSDQWSGYGKSCTYQLYSVGAQHCETSRRRTQRRCCEWCSTVARTCPDHVVVSWLVQANKQANKQTNKQTEESTKERKHPNTRSFGFFASARV